jgi:dTDP-4-amino-4,6-dideoxygalactose transaminase
MPTAGTPYKLSDIFAAISGFCKSNKNIFSYEKILCEYFNTKHVKLVNSGTTACYILLEYLKTLRSNTEQTEVILTDYTAPSLLLPIQKAGLQCVVADISKQDFNIAISQIESKITEKTLAIMPVHMFGIPTDIEPILEIAKEKKIFVIEDAASSLGSKIDNNHTGCLADFGFYSLNRGKNISTLSGGIITWRQDKDSAGIEKYVAELPKLAKTNQLKLLMKFLALTLAVRPVFYTILNAFISKFKYTTLHEDFESFAYTPFQAAVGKNLWKREQHLTQARIENGKKLLSIFSGKKDIQPPEMSEKMTAAFNQFPILIKDLKKLAQFEKYLLKNGLETSRLYGEALHEIFPKDIQNASHQFPQAEYLAKHLLLLPPHAQIHKKQIDIIESVAKEIFS